VAGNPAQGGTILAHWEKHLRPLLQADKIHQNPLSWRRSRARLDNTRDRVTIPLRRRAGPAWQECPQSTDKDNSMRKYGAEFFGTFWLVLGGCGSAVLAAAFPDVGIGLLGVSLAFGLTVLTMAYAIGHISGCHLNPAISIGLWAGGRFPAAQVVPYIVSQVLGAVVAGGVLYLIASGKVGFDVSAGFASNGYDDHSPGKYSMQAALISEVVMTGIFLLIIMGATDKRAPQGFAPIAIGLALTLIHLISIPVTNTSVKPARSTGVAVFVGDWAVRQLWLFWVAPIIGGVLGSSVYRWIGSGAD
jgi:aquaporin Z